LRWRNLGGNDAVISTIIIIGYVFAIVVNPLVNIFYLFMLIRRKPLLQTLPKWLVLANFIFLLLQLQYLLFLNDTFHY
jgi:hypothetical protein